MMFETLAPSAYTPGTMFTTVVDGREYWITAKHLVTGATTLPWGVVGQQTVPLRVLSSAAPSPGWKILEFSALDTGTSDIAVLFANHPLVEHTGLGLHLGSGGLTLGNPCDFLGFQNGWAWRASIDKQVAGLMPFVKHCFVAGFLEISSPAWVLDGVTSPGFAGGPVVFGNGDEQSVLGVMSGNLSKEVGQALFPADPASGTTSMPSPVKSPPQINDEPAGLILAYDIGVALAAINRHPDGPLIDEH